MASIKTRIAYDRVILATAQADLSDAAAAVASATSDLSLLTTGDLELAALTVGGIKFINNAGVLEPQ
jgi:hypothetical protein